MFYTWYSEEERKEIRKESDEYIEYLVESWRKYLGQNVIEMMSKQIVNDLLCIGDHYVHKGGIIHSWDDGPDDDEWYLLEERRYRNYLESYFYNRNSTDGYQFYAELFGTLHALSKIGVKKPIGILILKLSTYSEFRMICETDIRRYVDAHGETVVADILNILIEQQLFPFMLDLDADVFFNKEYPDPYDAIEEATGSALR